MDISCRKLNDLFMFATAIVSAHSALVDMLRDFPKYLLI